MASAAPDPRAADADYRPFPSFSQWAEQVGVWPVDVYARYRGVLDELWSRVEPAALRAGLEGVTRAAAVDTGAIEGSIAPTAASR